MTAELAVFLDCGVDALDMPAVEGEVTVRMLGVRPLVECFDQRREAELVLVGVPCADPEQIPPVKVVGPAVDEQGLRVRVRLLGGLPICNFSS